MHCSECTYSARPDRTVLGNNNHHCTLHFIRSSSPRLAATGVTIAYQKVGL